MSSLRHFKSDNRFLLVRSLIVSPCDVFPVKAAQEAVQQVADSSKETANTGKVQKPLSLKLRYF